mgnify:CR=1 FL=1
MPQRILIVDDEENQRRTLAIGLRLEEFEVSEAADGETALVALDAEEIHVAIVDLMMPGMNGFQATRTLSRGADTASIPIVVISSKSQETDKLWAMRQGAREYIVKPVKESELISKVNGVING